MSTVSGRPGTVIGGGRPLRGRVRELAEVAAVLDRPNGQCGTLVYVEGAVGSGRTRFLQECIELARIRGFRVNTSSPLRSREASETNPVGVPGERHLIVVDDADHLSDLEVSNLALMWDRGRGERVWLVARRPGPGTRRLDARLARPGREAVRIGLGPLDEDAVRELAADVLGVRPGSALTDLVGQADGNPGLIVELLTGLLEEHSIHLGGPRARLLADRLPQRLYHWTEAVLDECSPECRQFLRVRAVLGDKVSPDGCLRLLGTSPTALLPLIEEARWAGLLRTGPHFVFTSRLACRLISGMVPEAFRVIMQKESAPILPGAGPADRPTGAGDTVAEPGVRPPRSVKTRIPRARRPLTEQERHIVELVAEGLTNRQVARRLTISPNTVNYHLKKLFRTYGVGSRVELVHVMRSSSGGPAAFG